MPRTKLAEKYSAPKRPPTDPLKGVVLERISSLCLKNEDLAALLKCSPTTASRKRNSNMRDWTLGEILDFCKSTGVPIAELREAMRY